MLFFHFLFSNKDLLWTAPELLRSSSLRRKGTFTGDIYSFSIITQEVVSRSAPFCMLDMPPKGQWRDDNTMLTNRPKLKIKVPEMCFCPFFLGGRWMISGVITISPSLNVSVFCGSLGLHTQTGHQNLCWATHTNTELKRKGKRLELIPCASFFSNLGLCCFFVSWQRLSARSKSRLRCADLSCRWTRRRWKWYRLSSRAGVKSRRGGRPSKRSSNRWKNRRAPLTQTRFYTDKQ